MPHLDVATDWWYAFPVSKKMLSDYPAIVAAMVSPELAVMIAGSSSETVTVWCPGRLHIKTVEAKTLRIAANLAACRRCSGRSSVKLGSRSDIVAMMTEPHLADSLLISDQRSKIELRCPRGHLRVVTPAGAARSGGASKCAQCGYDKRRDSPRPGRSLEEVVPNAADELIDQSLRRLNAWSRLVTSWLCRDCGFVWETSLSKRAQGSGCTRCNLTGFNEGSESAILYLLAPPPGEHLIFGKVQSRERLLESLKGDYAGCQVIATTIESTAALVSAAEKQLRSMSGRPKGLRRRSITESLTRHPDSVDVWLQVVKGSGLTVDHCAPTGVDWTPPMITRQQDCMCATSSDVIIVDSKKSCCQAWRRKAREAINGGHYLEAKKREFTHAIIRRSASDVVAVLILSSSANSGMQRSMIGDFPARCLELSRLWQSPDDDMPLSKFVASALSLIQYPLCIASYADASQGHTGGIYRACSFNYGGWSDMLRSQPLRRGQPGTPFSEWEVLSAKHRYWTVVGVRGKRRRELLEAAKWLSLDHRVLGFAPISGHRRVTAAELEAAKIQPR